MQQVFESANRSRWSATVHDDVKLNMCALYLFLFTSKTRKVKLCAALLQYDNNIII